MRVWRSADQIGMGLIGLDCKKLWIFLDPKNPAGPALRLDLPDATNLLHAFFALVPEDENETLDDRIKEGKSLLGRPCPLCASDMWVEAGQWGSIMRCTRCNHFTKITKKEATYLAQVMKLNCNNCGGQLVGRGVGSSVFLGCANYPKCTWTTPLEKLV